MKTPLLLLALLLASPAAQAADGSGEARQLTEQLVSFVERGAWPAADRTYRKLEAVDGVELTSDDLFMGAEAARALGDMLSCRERLIVAFQKGLDEGSASHPWDERARAWLAELQTSYGHVSVLSKGIGQLEISRQPFQPDRRAAIAFASEQISTTGRFSGLLPAGSYSWGKSKFAVDAGTDIVKVKVKGPKK